MTAGLANRSSQRIAVRQKIVGKQVSYSLSLWERARVRARSVAKKGKAWGSWLCSLIPHPNPLPKGEGDWALTTDKVLAH